MRIGLDILALAMLLDVGQLGLSSVNHVGLAVIIILAFVIIIARAVQHFEFHGQLLGNGFVGMSCFIHGQRQCQGIQNIQRPINLFAVNGRPE